MSFETILKYPAIFLAGLLAALVLTPLWRRLALYRLTPSWRSVAAA